jgi:hypothetical protein
VWTIFRAEVAHFKTQHVAYRKTGLEWEILGDLGMRLHHKEEAKEAYQRCLDTPRYSVKPWSKLMEMYADEGDIQRSIQTAIRVAAYQYAEYTEMTVRSSLESDYAVYSMAYSTRHKSRNVSSNWGKSTDTPKSRTPCSVWDFLNRFSKLWTATCSTAKPSKSRVSITSPIKTTAILLCISISV